jgi:predicted small lipoprotein YifL
VQQSVNRLSRIDLLGRIALAAVLTGALGLAACGRKGPLDPPPSASLTEPPPPAAHPGLGAENYGTPPGAPPPAAVAPSGPPPAQKAFFLDFLVGK